MRSPGPLPLTLLECELGDSVKRQWREMEIQAHEGDGGTGGRRGGSVVWLLICEAQLSNNLASTKPCLQGHGAKPADTAFWCGEVWPDTSPGSAGIQQKPTEESDPKNRGLQGGKKIPGKFTEKGDLLYR